NPDLHRAARGRGSHVPPSIPSLYLRRILAVVFHPCLGGHEAGRTLAQRSAHQPLDAPAGCGHRHSDSRGRCMVCLVALAEPEEVVEVDFKSEILNLKFKTWYAPGLFLQALPHSSHFTPIVIPKFP